MISNAAALEEHVRPCLFRVTDAVGNLLGSAFSIAGAVVTCAHVTDGHTIDDLRVGGCRVTEMIVGQRTDAAILKVDQEVDGLAVSLRRPELILAAGFPVEPGLTGPVFSTDSISGSTDISYNAGGRQYHSSGVWTLSNVLMSPGHSGGPVIDQQSGAVAGIVVANFRPARGNAGPSGFVLPMSKLVDDEQLSEHFAIAMRGTPRYGLNPNGTGAISWCMSATAAEIARMSEERLYDRERTVVRRSLDDGLKCFLEGPASVWALVDLSGLGKSTALASIADRVADRPVLLIRAMEIDDTSGLDGVVQKKLAAVAPPYVSGSPTLSTLVTADGGAPLIIVDGLNESALDVATMRDRWLPQAVRDAKGCKLLISCRPESWQQISERVPSTVFHNEDGRESGGNGFPVGEFTDDEWQAFVSSRFDDGFDIVYRLRNPLLLELAAELQDLPDLRTGRWDLLERWISRDCARAVDRAAGAVTPRRAEDTLERIAALCLENGERTLFGRDPITRDVAFEPLLRQHLLITEGSRYGFRYDVLFEHLAARSLVVEKLSLSNGVWRQEEREIDWAIVGSFSEGLARNHDRLGVEVIWSQLEAQHELPGWKAMRLLAVLPISIEREATAMLLLERFATERLGGLSLIGSNLSPAEWRHPFASAVLHLAVRAASGYDFREGDLFEPMRFQRNRGQFEFQGFRRYIATMLSKARRATLEDLGRWHEDKEWLGAIWGDSTLESTVSSWTSCCFVFCSDLFTDEELLSVPSPRFSRPVFVGLARQDPTRLLRLARSLAANPGADLLRLRIAISTLNYMATWSDDARAQPIADDYAALACELALERYDDLGSDQFKNEALAWCARSPELQDEAWRRLVLLAEAGVAESAALQAFLPYRPEDAVELARRLPHGFATRSGNIILDLARPRFGSGAGIVDKIASLQADLMREYVSVYGLDGHACEVIEDLLYVLSVEQADRLRIVDLAVEATQIGVGASPLVYFAGDQNRAMSGAELEIADRLACTFAKRAVLDLAEHVLMLRIMRARGGQLEQSELDTLRKIASTIASRFGATPVATTLDRVSPFLQFGNPTVTIAICDAVRGDLSDAGLDGVIAAMLI
ncbi:trypsin-like peptidase domain-containing protein [Agrobacterium sp. DKPNP3]|uniref:trypsin-like peptidase domain-containing protein n=1 Tax=Agrobacterium sp. DKPNP3 TaxID=3457323 RepID=UPI00404469C4